MSAGTWRTGEWRSASGPLNSGRMSGEYACSVAGVSFVNKLFGYGSYRGDSGSNGSSEVADDFDYATIDNCPYCHQGLQGWGCVSCNVEFVLEDNTRLVERAPEVKPRCVRCGGTMPGGRVHRRLGGRRQLQLVPDVPELWAPARLLSDCAQLSGDHMGRPGCVAGSAGALGVPLYGRRL